MKARLNGRVVPFYIRPGRILLAVAAIAMTVFVAGCGGDSSSETTATDSAGSADAGGDQGLTTAQSTVEEFENPPTGIGLSAPLGKVPPGKTVYYLQCGAPACQQIRDAAVEAGEKIGLNVKGINQGTTVEEITSAWNQAVNGNPDAVFWSGTGTPLVKNQIKALADKKVPMVALAANLTNTETGTEAYPEGGAVKGVEVDLLPIQWAERNATLLADWAIADSGGNANVLYVNFPEAPIYNAQGAKLKSTFEENCPDCSYSAINGQADEIAKGLPGQVVSHLQQNPDTDYVILAFNNMMLGVPEALKAAGLADSVKLQSIAGDQVNMKYVKDGEQAMDVANSQVFLAWKAIDAVARLLSGQGPAETKKELLPTQILTQDSIDFDYEAAKGWPGPADFEQQFEELWGVG